ncbi:TolC family protein [Cytophagaceae bacterium ABcell3]|nr:TolC family protein [Cytophagaceae bacterium ABcell3]
MKRLLVIFVAVILFSERSTAQNDTLFLNVNEAVSLSLRENRNIQISHLEIDMASSGVREARGRLLPRVEASGSYNYNILRPVIFLPPGSPFGEVLQLGADHSFSGTLSGSVPIYSGGIYPGIRLAETNVQLARESDRETRINTVAEVKRNYYNTLLALESVRVMEVTHQNALQNFRQVRQQFDQGVVSEYELVRAEVQLQSVLPSLEQSIDNYQVNMEMLKLSIGLAPGTAMVLTDSLRLERADVELEVSVEDNPSLRRLRYQNVLAEQQVSLAQSAKHPTLSAFANYQMQTQAEHLDITTYDWVNTSITGLQLNIPIFNGLMTNQQIEQARIGKKQIEQQRKMTDDAIKTQVQNQLFLMRQAWNRYQAQQNSVQLAERGLRIARTRYTGGIGTLLELNDAELALTQARLNYLQAIYDYNIAHAEYERLTGRANIDIN